VLRKIAPFVAAALAVVASTSPATAATPRPLVYVVVVDALDGDRVDEGRAPFLASLLRGEGARAAYYRESRSVMTAETNPNHVAMMSGAYIDRSGVPGNSFGVYAPTPDGSSCRFTGPVDETRPPSKVTGESPTCPTVEMAFESIRRQGNPDDLVSAAIFGKPKLAAIFAGRRANGRDLDVDHMWAPCSRSANVEGEQAYCRQVPREEFLGYALNDTIVMDEVLRTIREGVGPTRRRPDLTFVSLHTVDSLGHAMGADAAYDEAIAMADAEIKRLVGELRERGEWGRTVMIVLSDHSMETVPERSEAADMFEAAGIPQDRYVILQNGSVDMVYLANRRAPDRFALLKRMREVALASGRIQEALYREPNPLDGRMANTLDGAHPDWHAAGPRTGDLYLTHRPSGRFLDPVASANPLAPLEFLLQGSHGAPQTRDNFFAVIGGGDFVVHQDRHGRRAFLFDDTAQNPGQAENVDVAPTVMGLFGLRAPDDSAGRFLGEAFDGRRMPGFTAPQRPRLRVERLPDRRRRGARAAGRARARAELRLQRYRATWSPGGGSYDVAINMGRRARLRLAATRRTSLVFTRPQGRSLRVYLRARSASGARSRAASVTVGPRARRLR
jgi:hypothetical protein